MSRVDEARRRAASRGGDVRPVIDATLPDLVEDTTLLEAYPWEGRTTAAPAVSSAPVQPPRTIVAPSNASSGHLGSLGSDLAGKLVGNAETPPIVVEQYRRLAASLHQLQTDVGLKSLIVTSAMPRDGKSLTVTNLALTLSGSYRKRVLLIDADLRRPSLHEIFRLPATDGLSESLSSGNPPHLLELSPLLSILPAGKVAGDPLSALTSPHLAVLVDQCAAAFDWVLLDAPPVGLMPDAGVLARLTKAVVFVIGAGSTPYKIIERAIAELGRDYIVGTVLNRIDEQHLPEASAYAEYYGAQPTE